jgi:universal stress protein F
MNRILVALDATPNADFVLKRAMELAQAMRAKVRLLHVVPMEAELPLPGAIVPTATKVTEAAVAAALARLDRMELDVPEPMRDGIAVEVGPAAGTIETYAKKYDPAMIVVGAHPHGVFARALGTTAAHIVNHADRPVCVVRPDPDDAEDDVVPHEHALLGATTITAGVVGAALGAIGGPPGAIAGGVIGTAVGALAGVALGNDDARTDAHDRELDDDIGVTSGDLGAREKAASDLTFLEKVEEASTH